MRTKKGFKMAAGTYYFDINNGYQNTITLSRKDKNDAIRTFARYVKYRKNCKWLGQWDGKKFQETDFQKFSTGK